MKVKFLGIIWDFTIPVLMFLAFVGCSIIAWPFLMSSIGWWNVPMFILFLLYTTLIIPLMEHITREIK